EDHVAGEQTTLFQSLQQQRPVLPNPAWSTRQIPGPGHRKTDHSTQRVQRRHSTNLLVSRGGLKGASAKPVCGIMERPSLPARRPSTGSRTGPVRDLLGGGATPAASIFGCRSAFLS